MAFFIKSKGKYFTFDEGSSTVILGEQQNFDSNAGELKNIDEFKSEDFKDAKNNAIREFGKTVGEKAYSTLHRGINEAKIAAENDFNKTGHDNAKENFERVGDEFNKKMGENIL